RRAQPAPRARGGGTKTTTKRRAASSRAGAGNGAAPAEKAASRARAGAATAASGRKPGAAHALPTIGLSPERLMELQKDYVQRLSSLWRDFVERPDSAREPIRDARFSDPAWQQNPLASFYARAYLLNAEFMNRLAASVDADPKLQKRLRFAVSQWVDAASPSNFI